MKKLAMSIACIAILLGLVVSASPFVGVTSAQTPFWETKEPLPEVMSMPSSVAVNGKIYAISSSYAPHDISLNYEYDPVGDTWTKKATPPTSDRYGMGAAVYDNKVYLFGGVAHGSPLSDLAIYDPETDTWTTGTNMPSASFCPSATLINGKIYVVGGTSPTHQIYDPVTDSWTTGATMPTNRLGAAATAVDNKLYVIGGSSGATRLAVVEQYDPITDNWTPKTPMPIGRRYMAAVASNGLIHVIGGVTNAGVTGSVSVYNPATDTWHQYFPDMPTPRAEFGDSSDAVINNVIYMVGGGGGATGAVVEALVLPSTPPTPTPTPTPTTTPPPSEGGCFIATAAYGSYLDSHVETLRDFRDSYMVTNPVGSALVSAYYKLSPPVADFIDDHQTLKPIVRVGLLPAVAMSTVAVSTSSAEKVAIVGSLALLSVALAVWAKKRRGRGSQYS